MPHRNRLRSVWNRVGSGAIHRAPRHWQAWLSDAGSLTQRLEFAFAQRVDVVVLSDCRQTLLSDESRFFHGRVKRCRVREVALLIDQKPVVVARSVIPINTASGSNQAILKLGKKPLGAILFQGHRHRQPKANREIAQLHRHHPLWKKSQRHFPLLPRDAWARRTCYYLKGHALLVNEIFLFDPQANRALR